MSDKLQAVAGPTRESDKIQSLEGLRGLMAWWVVLGHLSKALNWRLPLIDQNTLAVDVFIMLSGFVIIRLIDRKREPYLPYLMRRAFRIFPLYLVVLALSTILLSAQDSAWSNIPFHNEANSFRSMLAAEGIARLPLHLLAHITLLQGVVPNRFLDNSGSTLVGQAWSVSLEWQFYIIAPLYALTLRSRFGTLVAGCIVCVVAALTNHLTGAFLAPQMPKFCIGIVTYLLMKNDVQKGPLLLLLATFSALIAFFSHGIGLIPIAIWGSTIASVRFAGGHRLGFINRLLRHTALVRQGQLTYSIYLVHMLPLMLGVFLLNSLSANETTYQFVLPVLTIVATLILANLTFRWIETPGIKLGFGLSKRLLNEHTLIAKPGDEATNEA